LVYQILRQRGELKFSLADASGVASLVADASGVQAAPSSSASRDLVIAALVRIEGLSADDVAARFDGSQYGPTVLTDDEQAMIAHLGTADTPDSAPDWVRGNYRQGLDASLRAGLGDNVVAEMAAMIPRASTDLRVNTLKSDRGAAQASLDADGIQSDLTPLSPIGLRVKGRARIAESVAFRSGLIEIQDEGAQIAALLVDAKPGQTVVDYCAGAGGKSLGLAAAMENSGIIHAFDVNPGRLGKSKARFSRSDVKCVIAQKISGGDDPAAQALKGLADRVLVDAPCTGSGTWRRAPEGKWRVTEKTLLEQVVGQRSILDDAAPLVRPGGRLVYVTCSIFADENQAQADWFLENHENFQAIDVGKIWGDVMTTPAPATNGYLQLTPLGHGTDGFFVAVFERNTE
ncbi:MAG: RsmB/NOP family class I SAM-dependent RNA methyltransferase, partial [Alphaproteobacteria bacterium]|nr:RsmB/NOP family class I SAM-dependent RNA methyltransferase [Alphaproteobacteria bacterium]